MPLPTVTLGIDGIRTTSIGFGCASLFRISSRTRRSALLHTAYDSGLRHFDVAPMYGLGRAERELGVFARRRRAELTIATKFGIRPTLAARGLSYSQGQVRRLFAARPQIRDQARVHAAAASRRLYVHGGFHAAGARRSLERSLRALRTDYIDLFLLHDPVPGSVCSEEVRAYLEEVRTAGLIRSWGIAGDRGPTDEVARSFGGAVPVRQLRDDVLLQPLRSHSAEAGVITFGVIASVLRYLVEHVSADDSRRLRWNREVGADCSDPEVAASFLLRAALRNNSSGVVLFSSTHSSHIRIAATTPEIFHSPEDTALDAFLRMVDTELRQDASTGGGRS